MYMLYFSVADSLNKMSCIVTISCCRFQGREWLEGVLRSEDHHNEDGHQELLRQPHVLGGGSVFLSTDPPLVSPSMVANHINHQN